MQAQNPFPAPAGLDGTQRLSGTCSEYDEIRLETGNLLRVVQVASIPTLGLPMRFGLVYNGLSDSPPLGPVGYFWRHNLMANLDIGMTLVTFTDETGREYDFAWDGTNWVLQSNSFFVPMKLTNPSGDTWRVTFQPSQDYMEFVAGQLTSIGDNHGNALTLTYESGLVVSLSEPTGRQLLFAYEDGLLVEVTDPRGYSTHLSYDEEANLTQVLGPEGCTLNYGYTTPANHLLTSRTDALGHTYSYAYDDSQRLSTVSDAETSPHTLTYSYDTVDEYGGDEDVTLTLSRTTLVDARGKSWDFRFTPSGDLWRILDPLGHQRRFYWSATGGLLYETQGFTPQSYEGTLGPKDNLNNRFRRRVYDTQGDLLQDIDATGLVTVYTYDSQQNLLTVTPGQAHLGIQGGWQGILGQDGYLLCAYVDDSTDVTQLPAYVSGVVNGDGADFFTLFNPVQDDYVDLWPHLMDSRTPSQSQTGLPSRAMGFWTRTEGYDLFKFQLTLSEDKAFNLSLYTHSADLTYSELWPLQYCEQFGRDIVITVQDVDPATSEARERSFHISNNAPGFWVTFAVNGTVEGPITVTLQAGGATSELAIVPVLAMLAFDPLDNHTTSFVYNETSDLTSVTDPLGNLTQLAYNDDGTLESVTDARSHETQMFYLDDSKNLTKITDPVGHNTFMTYDLNGNLLSLEDPDGRFTHLQYDGKNRLIGALDGEDHLTALVYDANGNVSEVIDAAGRTTLLTYTPTNRLASVTDPLGNEVTLAYDEAGNLTTVTDARSNETVFVFDDAGRMVQVVRPDTREVHFAWDALNRVIAITSPNGNLSSLSDINLTGARNHFLNPSLEEDQPEDPSLARYWFEPGEPGPAGATRSTAVQRTGRNSLSLPLPQMVSEEIFAPPGPSTGSRYQNHIKAPPGARYLMQAWVSKTADGIAASVDLQFQTRDFFAALNEVTSSSLDLDGSTAAWQAMPSARLDLNADAQVTATNPSVEQFLISASSPTVGLVSGGTTLYFDDFALLRLSTAYLYDGEQLREVSPPDGNRLRLEYDRYGRVQTVIDPLGRSTVLFYDSLDRVVQVTDPLGQNVSYVYDPVGNLSSFTDARGMVTSYTYDDLDRLATITYPDTSTEQFTYTDAGLLYTYTNVRGQMKVFTFDNAARLAEVAYETDSSTVLLSYDAVDNLVTLTERNGDRLYFVYDALNRLVSTSRTRTEDSTNPTWAQRNGYDANSNRVRFNLEAAVYGTAHYAVDSYGSAALGPNVYDTARYHTGRYGLQGLSWSVPDPGFDGLDRMPAFQDAAGRQVSFTFDPDGRRASIAYPNGALTLASYDIVGRLLSLSNLQAQLQLAYGYNQASDRIAMTHNQDTWDYALDFAGRLILECVNCFVDSSAAHFAQGQLTAVQIDPGLHRVGLLPIPDSFDGSTWNADRWRFGLSLDPGDDTVYPLGLQMYQQDGLHLSTPRGGSDLLVFTVPPVYDSYGMDPGATATMAAEHRAQLSGDFDILVEFADWEAQCQAVEDVQVGSVQVALMISTLPFEQGGGYYIRVGRSNIPSGGDQHLTAGVTGAGSYSASATTTLTAGKYRLVRSGSDVTAYYWDGSSWVVLLAYTGDSTFVTDDVLVSLYFEQYEAISHVRLTNFGFTSSEEIYPNSGYFVSGVMDAGRSVTWNSIQWTEWLPADTDVEFLVAVYDDPAAAFTYVGPTGGGFFTTSTGEALPDGLVGRYCRYTAFLSTTDPTVSPTFSNVQIGFSGLQSSAMTVYQYDPAGNRTGKTTVTSSGQVVETLDDPSWSSGDRINSLNQVMRRDITTGAGTTTWTFSWDADGNMTGKTDGTDTWAYVWDEDNRLLSASLNDVTQVAYTYDAMGRMLTRTEYVDGDPGTPALFVWDGGNVVQETAPDGTLTHYYCPQGELHSFKRGSFPYFVHGDALGNVRAITDFMGNVVSHFEYDAWGNVMDSSVDGVPGGFPYLFVGGLGVRVDDITGLYYMRARWMDPALGRFVSRDLLKSSLNTYLYAFNTPQALVDPVGLDPVPQNQTPWTLEQDRYNINQFPYYQKTLNDIHQALLKRFAGNEECKKAVDGLRNAAYDCSRGVTRTDIPTENVLDWLLNKVPNVLIRVDSELPLAKWETHSQSLGNFSQMTIGSDFKATALAGSPPSDDELEIFFHELLHIAGAGHTSTDNKLYYSDPHLAEELLLTDVVVKCKFNGQVSNDPRSRKLYFKITGPPDPAWF